MTTDRTNGKRTTLLAGAALGTALVGRELFKRRREADLTGNVALITGGTTGLGFLLAREFAEEGCKIAICARDEDELEAARQRLSSNSDDVLALQCDVSDRDQVERLINRVTEELGQIDILVNNAGIIQVGPIDTMTVDDFENAMGIMFWGMVYPSLNVIPQMIERGSGRIVNITSIGSIVSVPHMIPYNSAKFAARGFSEGLRAELSPRGISVTTINPGLMRTGSFKNAEIKGEQEKEFLWFSLGSSLPGVSMDAERAARQIVQATKRGEPERTLSLPATVLAKVHGLIPGVTQRVLSGVDRFILPDANGAESDGRSGREVEDELDSRLLGGATAMGQSAAKELQPDE